MAPELVTAYWSPDGELEGIAGLFELDGAALERAASFDPAARHGADHVARNGGLCPGETVVFARFFIHRTSDPANPARTEFQARGVARCLAPPVPAWSFLPLRTSTANGSAPPWRKVVLQASYEPVPGSQFVVDDQPQDLLAQDWRRVPPDRWLDLLAERALLTTATADPPARPAERDALTETEVRAAVRSALKVLHRDDVLQESPLSRLRALRDTTETPAVVIRRLLVEASQSLRGHPRDEKLHRALHATYLQPAETQELAAERLDLPFSTYRRHLVAAVDRVAEWVWKREAG